MAKEGIDIGNLLEENARETRNILLHFLDELQNAEPQLLEACKYGLIEGQAKYIRSFLIFAAGRFLGVTKADLLPFAAAVEMIHAYSLVHDDLPCMDNSDLRRGKPALHKKFDEATALLSGNCLLTLAFEVMANSAHSHASKIILETAKAIGAEGMMAGQMRDLAFQKTPPQNIEEFFAMNRNKTGRLIELCIKIPMILHGTTNRELTQYSEALGRLYQITDDLLDYEEAPFYAQIYGSKQNLARLIGEVSSMAEAVNSAELSAFASFIKKRIK